MFRLDAARSSIELRTYAEGMLSAVAHDLSLRCEGATGEGRLAPEIEATLRFPVTGLRVRGVLKASGVEEGAPLAIERREIERRIREDVFPRAQTIEVIVKGRTASVQWPGGRTTSTLQLAFEEEGAAKVCRGQAVLSLSALGVKPILGPLRAFRVRDQVEVSWKAVLAPTA